MGWPKAAMPWSKTSYQGQFRTRAVFTRNALVEFVAQHLAHGAQDVWHGQFYGVMHTTGAGVWVDAALAAVRSHVTRLCVAGTFQRNVSLRALSEARGCRANHEAYDLWCCMTAMPDHH